MIAVVAGTGTLPLAACKQLILQKKDFFVLSLFPEDNLLTLKQLVQDNAKIIVQSFCKLSNILETLKIQETKEILFIGKVDKRNLLKKLQWDWLFFKLAAKALYKSDTAIMELLVSTAKKHSMHVISQKDILKTLLVPPGIITGYVDAQLERDIQLGLSTAQALSKNDIGQTVVVKNGMVLAVEAIEGTDNCIKRGIELGKQDVVICKAARPDQNSKFDLPTIGPGSLDGIKKGQVRALAWQSSQTFVAEKETFIKIAKKLGITLISR
jgi:DUF1009 family protein